ncbi:MAG: hypothetical protein HYW85_04695 [Deltaproteobacteria bacterium]|nr:hypothetical protein [Deltaproteobacteria bacterium]MBI3016393.1 hypothetical protein [Deltaproteobacteria bacterium]
MKLFAKNLTSLKYKRSAEFIGQALREANQAINFYLSARALEDAKRLVDILVSAKKNDQAKELLEKLKLR